ncbi:MAG: hypothetical protein ACYC3S_18185 [Chloroflexota bacterium]
MTALRGIVRAFDAGTHTATVQIDGSRSTAQTVAVSKGIAAGEMVAGRSCAILEFWPNDPAANVLVAVWP